jgi:hypothetical protein
MPPRKPRPAPDPLASLKVEVSAELGATSFKADCLLPVAAEVAARLHQELERLGKLKPNTLPVAEAHGGALYVPDEDDYEAKKKLGF